MSEFISLTGKFYAEDPVTGNKVALTAVEDNNGDWVLRTVNSAPQAYVEGGDYLNVREYDSAKIVILAQHRNINVGASAIFVVRSLDNKVEVNLDAYNKYIVIVRGNAAHNFKIKAYAYMTSGTFGTQASDYLDIISVTAGVRATSGIKEVIGLYQTFTLENLDTEYAHQYDVDIYGVR